MLGALKNVSERNIYDEIEEELYEMIVGRVREGDTVLDVGCGECHLANLLAKRKGCRVTGVDTDDSGFAKGLAEAEAWGTSDLVECLKIDARSLNSTIDKMFEVAVSVYALHEYEEALQVLKEVRKILKPGGKILLVDFLKGSTAERLWSERYYTPTEMKSVMRRAGFGGIELEFPWDRELVFAIASGHSY